ncbi:hypothetical protein V8F20_002699 [Naviculisporaceae sp. PSN 640]
MVATGFPDLFILDNTLSAAEYREKLMGAFVVNPHNPSYRYRPVDPRRPIKVVPGMDPKPVLIRDIQKIVNTTHEKEFRAKIQNLLDGHFGKDQSSSTESTAKIARKYTMDQPPDQLLALLKDKKVFDEVLELYETDPGAKNTGKLYFVTFIVTFSGWKFGKSDGAGKELGMGVTLHEPNTQLSAQVGGSGKATVENITSGEYTEEMIFGIGYHTVTLEKKKGFARLKRLSPLNRRSAYILTPHPLSYADLKIDPVRARGDGHLGMGPADPGKAPVEDPEEVAAKAEVEEARKEVGFQIREFPQ